MVDSFKVGLIHLMLDSFVWHWPHLFNAGLVCLPLFSFFWCWTHSFNAGLIWHWTCLMLDSSKVGLIHLTLDSLVRCWTCLFDAGLIHLMLDLFVWCWTHSFNAGLVLLMLLPLDQCSTPLTLDQLATGLVGCWTFFSWTHSMNLLLNQYNSFVAFSFWIKIFWCWTHSPLDLFAAGVVWCWTGLMLDLFLLFLFWDSSSCYKLDLFDAGLVQWWTLLKQDLFLWCGTWTHSKLHSFEAALFGAGLIWCYTGLVQCYARLIWCYARLVWCYAGLICPFLSIDVTCLLLSLLVITTHLMLPLFCCMLLNSFASSSFSTSPCFMQLICCFIFCNSTLLTWLVCWFLLVFHFLSFSTTSHSALATSSPTSYPPAMQLIWHEGTVSAKGHLHEFHGTMSTAIFH